MNGWLVTIGWLQVRQVSHWVTTTTPNFYEPMRTAATFKMLPDPAFVVTAHTPCMPLLAV